MSLVSLMSLWSLHPTSGLARPASRETCTRPKKSV